MPTVALVDPRAHVSASGGALVVQVGGDPVQTLQPHQITELHLHAKVELTAGARLLLLREGIDVAFFTLAGRYVGRLSPAEMNQGHRRIAQYQAVCDPQRRLAVARALVDRKLDHQRAFLVRRQRRLRDPDVADATAAIRALRERLAHVEDLDALRGHEGAAARLYFGAFAKLITNDAFVFSGRNRYPPRDPVNAALSFGYTLLVSAMDGALRRASLDPYVGFLHEAGRGAGVLAFDLVEPFRPLVDRLVITLINRQQIGPEDFRKPLPEELGARAELADEAVFLDAVARRILIRAWEQTLEQTAPHPTQEGRYSFRNLMPETAYALARFIEGDTDTLQLPRIDF